MKLFIRLLNNNPIEHPITEQNMQLAYPDIDLNNLPDNFANFKRLPQPLPDVMPVGPYQKAVANYVLSDDGKSYQDEWVVHNLSAEEKAKKIALYKQNPPSSVFIFNEETCSWENPIPKPLEHGFWEWDYEKNIWVDLYPTADPTTSVDFT